MHTIMTIYCEVNIEPTEVSPSLVTMQMTNAMHTCTFGNAMDELDIGLPRLHRTLQGTRRSVTAGDASGSLMHYDTKHAMSIVDATCTCGTDA